MKPLYTYELANLAGVSKRTLQRWMLRHRPALLELGYRPHDKYIAPRALAYLCREFCIEIDGKQM